MVHTSIPYKAIYEKKLSLSNLILFRQLFNNVMPIKETEQATTHVITFNRMLIEVPSQTLSLDE